jgi:hypothetical protein
MMKALILQMQITPATRIVVLLAIAVLIAVHTIDELNEGKPGALIRSGFPSNS